MTRADVVLRTWNLCHAFQVQAYAIVPSDTDAGFYLRLARGSLRVGAQQVIDADLPRACKTLRRVMRHLESAVHNAELAREKSVRIV